MGQSDEPISLLPVLGQNLAVIFMKLRGRRSQKLLYENLPVQKNGNFVKETYTSGYFVV